MVTEYNSKFIIRDSVGIDKVDLESVPITSLYTEFQNVEDNEAAKNILIDDESALVVKGKGHILKFNLKDITYQIFGIGVKTGFGSAGKNQLIKIGLDVLQVTQDNVLEFIPLLKPRTTDSLYVTLQGNTQDSENNIKRFVLYGYPIKIYDPNKKQK